MSGNSIGTIFKLSTFGESHGKAIGGVLEGCPAGMDVDVNFIQLMLSRRKPGQSEVTSPRKEDDEVEILSGIFENKTLGTPIGFLIRNKDSRPADYDHLKEQYRPSHADFTWDSKYGIRDYRGGGRASARETACRVVGGAIAMQYLKQKGIKINAWVSAAGGISIPDNAKLNLDTVYDNDVRCPHNETAKAIEKLILQMKEEGDTIGGIISCSIKGVPAGIGEPVFDKLHATIGKAMLSINAVKGFEIGTGFAAANMKGSEHNDEFISEDGKITTKTNHSGGIQGGISNGNEIHFKTAFKPVATIMKPQQTVQKDGTSTTIINKGRHDSCVLPRAVPIVESMAALVIADYLIMSPLSKF